MKLTYCALWSLTCFVHCSCEKKLQPETVLLGGTMGSHWAVTLAKPLSDEQGFNLREELQGRLDALEQTFSHWRDDSELSRWNAQSTTEWVPVSIDMAAVVSRALELSAASGGALDVTVAPLVRLWGFAPSSTEQTSKHRVPSKEAIEAAMQHCGWRKLEVRQSPPALRKLDAEVQINLSSVVEGYAADQLGSLLLAHGISDALIDVGGEMLAMGLNRHGKPWQVGIQTPSALPGEAMTAVPLSQQALATSGTYRQHFESGGQSFSHILDPRTGRPVQHRLVSVSVIHERAVMADGWATALMVLGPKEGRELAERLGLRAIFIEAEDAPTK
jgi:FAD:protein FMN transferase